MSGFDRERWRAELVEEYTGDGSIDIPNAIALLERAYAEGRAEATLEWAAGYDQGYKEAASFAGHFCTDCPTCANVESETMLRLDVPTAAAARKGTP